MLLPLVSQTQIFITTYMVSPASLSSCLFHPSQTGLLDAVTIDHIRTFAMALPLLECSSPGLQRMSPPQRGLH